MVFDIKAATSCGGELPARALRAAELSICIAEIMPAFKVYTITYTLLSICSITVIRD